MKTMTCVKQLGGALTCNFTPTHFEELAEQSKKQWYAQMFKSGDKRGTWRPRIKMSEAYSIRPKDAMADGLKQSTKKRNLKNAT